MDNFDNNNNLPLVMSTKRVHRAERVQPVDVRRSAGASGDSAETRYTAGRHDIRSGVRHFRSVVGVGIGGSGRQLLL